LDDFGTGASSLGTLRRVPVDSVKIDRSLILELTTSPEAAALTRAVIAMSHSLGIQVIAEGVESREQWDVLDSLGCEEMQGDFFSPPVPPDVVAGIVQRVP